MSRNAFTPAQYSPATRRAMASIKAQLGARMISAKDGAGRFRLANQAVVIGLSLALEKIAEEHRQWADVETFGNARGVAMQEVSDFEFQGVLPPVQKPVAGEPVS